MNTRWTLRWLGTATLLALSISATATELVRNGDFSKDLPHWHVSPEKEYGYQPVFKVQNGTLTATGLKSVNSSYLIVRQALDIKQGKRYRLSFDYRGTPGTTFTVWVGEMNPSLAEPNFHFSRGRLEPAAEWQTFEAEFTGRYATDERWYRQWMSESRNNKLIQGRRTEGFKNLPERPEPGKASRSPIAFAIGGLEGEFALRKVSVTELE